MYILVLLFARGIFALVSFLILLTSIFNGLSFLLYHSYFCAFYLFNYILAVHGINFTNLFFSYFLLFFFYVLSLSLAPPSCFYLVKISPLSLSFVLSPRLLSSSIFPPSRCLLSLSPYSTVFPTLHPLPLLCLSHSTTPVVYFSTPLTP